MLMFILFNTAHCTKIHINPYHSGPIDERRSLK